MDKFQLMKEKLTKSIKKILKNHKVITFALSLFFILSFTNAFMIYNFIKIAKPYILTIT